MSNETSKIAAANSSERIVEIEILRYDPDTDEAPYYQTYQVPCQEEWVVLDAVNYIKVFHRGSCYI